MNRIFIALIALFLLTNAVNAQQTTKEFKVGHVFTITLPAYMSKTVGLNNDASIQYKSEVKEVYGFVIEDLKEELEMAEFKYTSIDEFYDDFMEDFSKDDEKKTVGTPLKQVKNGNNVIEVDYTFYSEEAKGEIYYLVGIVETKTSYYKVLSWCTAADKTKFKADFQKIVYSLKD